jgi:hypothetical protein
MDGQRATPRSIDEYIAAHAFYLALGFSPAGRRFIKTL